MWKDFFYYTKSERRVILLLLAIALLLLGIWAVMEYLRPVEVPVTLSESEEIDSFLANLEEQEKIRKSHTPKNEISAVLQPFDPNTADSVLLRQLGLPVYIVRNILKYRAKGGVFRSPESFSRIYGLKEEVYQKLKPYITIAPLVSVSHVRTDTFRQLKDTIPYIPKYEEGTIVDLNKADTSILKRIPGIGSTLARMIVVYRQRLGGFYDVSQLQEVPHVGVELNKWFVVTPAGLHKIQVNSASLDKLRSHPYMDFYKAKAIMEYRRKRGKIKGLSQLSMFEEFTEKDLKRLSPYLTFE
ncbi:helix-hairpin-helix domain-containing protein [Phocaeicola coprocola]|jgi:DNA uptake protein ComE-like DNA-binding protein|uniref:helix-hairpin-helix domain-containing protein n=1 Tax=Phocaeicola coprocola TaxID=310298 RepID=UPI001B6AF1F5|nr:helix-hairpin-helix domain-containing protein [Phocaeicola coprocola]MBP6499207.1 helix-hairpin-helix domain-containing protein [Phocaeicola sp.]